MGVRQAGEWVAMALDRHPEGSAALCAEALFDHAGDADLWQLLGLARAAAGDCPGAWAALEEASTLGELHPEAQIELAQCYARHGCTDLAAALFRDLGHCPDVPFAVLAAAARGLAGLGRHGWALDLCEELARRDPDSPAAAFGLCYYLHRLGADRAAVAAHLRRAFAAEPDRLLYRISLALLEDGEGRHAEAARLLAPVDLADVPWPHALHRMAEAFDAVGDGGRAAQCRLRLRELLSGGSQPGRRQAV